MAEGEGGWMDWVASGWCGDSLLVAGDWLLVGWWLTGLVWVVWLVVGGCAILR